MLYLIAAMLLALVLWSVAFVASANYQSKAIWSMPQEEWQSYPEIAAWMQHCETIGKMVFICSGWTCLPTREIQPHILSAAMA